MAASQLVSEREHLVAAKMGFGEAVAGQVMGEQAVRVDEDEAADARGGEGLGDSPPDAAGADQCPRYVAELLHRPWPLEVGKGIGTPDHREPARDGRVVSQPPRRPEGAIVGGAEGKSQPGTVHRRLAPALEHVLSEQHWIDRQIPQQRVVVPGMDDGVDPVPQPGVGHRGSAGHEVAPLEQIDIGELHGLLVRERGDHEDILGGIDPEVDPPPRRRPELEPGRHLLGDQD